MGRRQTPAQTDPAASRILVADDEEIAHLTLKRLLEPEGYTIHSVYGGKEALDEVDASYDLLILDVRMPDLDGIEVLREIRKRQLDIEVLILTGYATLESATQALNYGARAYVMKPIEDIPAFKSKVREAVHTSQLARSNRQFYDEMMSGQIDPMATDDQTRRVAAVRPEDREILQRLMEVMRDAVAFLDFDGNITFANVNLAQMLGMSYQELLGARFESYVAEVDKDKIVDVLTRLSNGQVAITHPAKLRTCYGNLLSVVISSSPIYREREYKGIAMVISNVTQMDRVRERVELLANLVENAQHDMIFVAKRDGLIVECNSLARRCFDYSRHEIVGLNLGQLLKSEGGEGWKDIEACVTRALSWRGEALGIAKGGKEFPVEVTVSESASSANGSANVICFMRDLSERKRAEREMAEAQANASRIEQLESELASLERLSHPPTTTITAQTFGLMPLREGNPDFFADLVNRYADLMDIALEQRFHKGDSDLSNDLRMMAERLGFWKAGPRDVVQIHTAAFTARSRAANPQKAQAYAEEARLLVLELMGHLATYYRSRSLNVWKRPHADEIEKE